MQHDGTAGKHLTLHPKTESLSPIMAELSPLTVNYLKEFLILLWYVGILNLAASLSSTDEKRRVQNGCRCTCESIKLSWGPDVNMHTLKSARQPLYSCFIRITPSEKSLGADIGSSQAGWYIRTCSKGLLQFAGLQESSEHHLYLQSTPTFPLCEPQDCSVFAHGRARPFLTAVSWDDSV